MLPLVKGSSPYIPRIRLLHTSYAPLPVLVLVQIPFNTFQLLALVFIELVQLFRSTPIDFPINLLSLEFMLTKDNLQLQLVQRFN